MYIRVYSWNVFLKSMQKIIKWPRGLEIARDFLVDLRCFLMFLETWPRISLLLRTPCICINKCILLNKNPTDFISAITYNQIWCSIIGVIIGYDRITCFKTKLIQSYRKIISITTVTLPNMIAFWLVYCQKVWNMSVFLMC